MRNDDKISAITLSTYNTTLQHGPSEGDSVWGPCDPPRDRASFGRGAGRCARVPKYKGFAVHKRKKARGFTYTHKTSLNLTSSTGGPVPVAT